MWLSISIGLMSAVFLIYFVVVVRMRLKQKRGRERAEELSEYQD